MASSRTKGLNIAVAVRRQTPEEERRFGDAVKIFLTELVHQHLRQKQHEQQ